jgi:hypothetical protein
VDVLEKIIKRRARNSCTKHAEQLEPMFQFSFTADDGTDPMREMEFTEEILI